MTLRTDTEYAALIAGIDKGFRAIQVRLKAVVLAREAGVLSPPAAARVRDTKMKDGPDPAASSSGLGRDSPSRRRASLPSPATDNVRKMCKTHLEQRSSLRRESPERRNSLTGISWSKDIEAVSTIPARAHVLDSFEDDACSCLSTPSAPSAKSGKPKRHTVMNSKWARGKCV
ncbi:hypothetical protein T484DRAFT_1903987 [Baffinella frigidus]|nr:hypothetical protein T484DRAFT_1903987 [Cryptophyta sp. CCMP2293]|mmetsp:Transcript_6942/g.16753  ORF Transcript_6942/g.16753 Transcript_6942/m.16753 type:complete len:173 (-) Transcript_6942:47-565(-)|eukprot:CAMPEP_0180134800 /NCGR_PEP_ID=MMETSP0986-20121125/10394_1 /TAXON_ID=697907 /ORGANISM="non described non described, Strain CCMP2293" /LENGTH=172 /DNA_ID=CAMNT_0022075263 /DNA_START=159 /DNA_END=677 /DNA_ORIENTATION=-